MSKIARLTHLRPLAAGLTLTLALEPVGAIAAQASVQPDYLADLAKRLAPSGQRTPLDITPWSTLAPSASAMTSSVTVPVTNCNDSGSGSLRDAVAQAAVFTPAIPVDMTQLACSTITLTTGAIVTGAHDLIVKGPGRNLLTIKKRSGKYYDRIFTHTGTGTLSIYDVGIYGGAIYSSSGVAQGGCIYSAHDVSLTRVDVSSCSLLGSTGAVGGGVYAAYGVTLDHSNISGNAVVTSSSTTGNATGGGVFGKSVVNAFYSTISGNSATTVDTNSSSAGGGIAAPVLICRSSTIDNNTADAGGGVFVMHDLSATFPSALAQCTISGNTGNKGAGGVWTKYSLSVDNSTIAFNRSGCANSSCSQVDVGGLLAFGSAASALSIYSSIVANNLDSSNAESDFKAATDFTVSGSHNLIMTVVSGSVAAPGDTLHSDPRLAALSKNGGPTRTHALTLGSPAVDHGFNSLGNTNTFDQRSRCFPRIVGLGTDMGAYELDREAIFCNGFE